MILRLLAPVFAAALSVSPLTADASYVQREDVRAFVRDMETRHGFDGGELLAALDRVRPDARVIRLITPPSVRSARSWQRYRARFLDDRRIGGGLEFWAEHAATLDAASTRFGVPAEIIVSIIGVETHYGRHTGNFDTLTALATLAFDYPPRAPLFQRELENLFLLAREQQREPWSYQGSYAGAIGYPQFLPSSVRHYAVDFDANGRIDFESDPIDAIGSVANYLAQHGWQPGAPIAVPARLTVDARPQPMSDAGIEPSLSPETLAEHGIVPAVPNGIAAPATFVELETAGAPSEYWLGYRNFYVITRYNRSSFYAMAVYELAEALRAAREGR